MSEWSGMELGCFGKIGAFSFRTFKQQQQHQKNISRVQHKNDFDEIFLVLFYPPSDVNRSEEQQQ